MESMPLERRAVFVMHEIDGLPVPEVAQALAVPLNTAYSRLRLARRDFATAIERLRGKP
jgi:RNA polymerase sigma-70 factor (ECF subfamily)